MSKTSNLLGKIDQKKFFFKWSCHITLQNFTLLKLQSRFLQFLGSGGFANVTQNLRIHCRMPTIKLSSTKWVRCDSVFQKCIIKKTFEKAINFEERHSHKNFYGQKSRPVSGISKLVPFATLINSRSARILISDWIHFRSRTGLYPIFFISRIRNLAADTIGLGKNHVVFFKNQKFGK